MTQNDLVRCKDCTRLNTYDCPWNTNEYHMAPLDFCSWGEREDYITNKERLLMGGDSNEQNT